MTGRVTERSLYPYLTNYLESLGFVACSEVRGNAGQLDILAIKEHEKFIIEVKLGEDSTQIVNGLTQVMDYAREHNTHNIMIIDYPLSYQETLSPDLRAYTLCSQTPCLAVTKYLNGKFMDKTPRELFDELNTNLESRRVDEVDLNFVIDVISESISKVTHTLQSISQEDMRNLIDLITGKYDLFLALSELRNNNESNAIALNLISYLIVNQMLFYHMFSTKSNRIPNLEEIEFISDLKNQFNNITEIDYKAIYQINIVDKLPENEQIINAFNDIINVFKIVKPELIEHDLMGRLFHELLPYETRKILAAFYTNPIAGDILAGLCIDNEDDNVIDPACGSGTLLVSAYNKKRQLTTNDDYHTKFVEEQLTGIDIMPFAAHLTAVNLSSQSIETTTEKLNVGVMDSLSISNEFKHKRVFVLDNFSRELQTTIDLFSSQQTRITEYIASEVKGAVSPDGDDNSFKIRKNSFDVLIGNPPFSDREKLPNDYLQTLNQYEGLTNICGSQINLWGYFIALSEFLLKRNGNLGFVIPINIFRGQATKKIRDYLLNNFTIKYVIKTGKNIAFSEKCSFRDVLIVAQKKEPSIRSVTKFVILNEDLHELSFTDAKNISKYIKEEVFTAGRELDITYYKQKDLIENSDNLMPYFGIMDTQNGVALSNFNNLIKDKLKDKLRKLTEDEISEGFHASPAGVSQMTFITNNYARNRLSRAFLIYEKEDETNLYAKIKGMEQLYSIPKSKIRAAFRTLTDVNTFNLDKKLDFFITDEFPNFQRVLNLSRFDQRNNQFSYEKITRNIDKYRTHMVVGRRFNPHSPNTSFFAFSSNEKFISPHTFKTIHLEKEDALINTLFLNSAIGILNIVLLKEQTTGNFTDIMQSDLLLLDILDINKLTHDEKNDLLDLYNEIQFEEFPSIIEQFDNEFPQRTKLDMRLLRILGFDNHEISTLLPEVYKAIAFELKNG